MKTARMFLLLCCLLVPGAQEALAHGHRTHVGVMVGVPFWAPFWDPFPWYRYPNPYPPVIVTPPPPPPVYIEQAVTARDAYWYYCESARRYYPEVQQCQEAWLPVLPRSE